ncbi:hypothetical protein [Coleofasciculus sp. G2-EDA-02]|uniref:hypothetical protein n=1 Tax=Coleofasciculus sp. G2-EDA-02 TaxID=3069529 RepID=UPI0032F21C52
MQCKLQLQEIIDDNFIKSPMAIASPGWDIAEYESSLLVIRPKSVCLNLEALSCFEVVEHQFHQFGVTFKNAIALQPSNPAYPPRSGTIVLMAAPKSGWLEATFSQPIAWFCCYVTSSQRTMMSAYDSQGMLIDQVMTQPNLAGSDSPTPPNTQLQIDAPNISRITFYAFDGQLTLADLSFEF